MSSIFLKIFWGYVIANFDLRIFIDLLADPIGYYLMYSGIKQLVKDFPIANKSKNIALVMIFYSIPSVFFEDLSSNFNWYYTINMVIDYILVFYLFQLIIEISKAANDPSFQKRAYWTGTIYFINVFIFHLFSSFALNLPINGVSLFLTIVLVVSSLVLEIMFLVLLLAVRKLYVKLDG